MEQSITELKIESSFRKLVRRGRKIRNAYLLVNSDKLGINLNIAEGRTGDQQATVGQPVHLASVGKLFTATIIGMLNERGEVGIDDSIANFLEPGLIDRLHIYKGRDYSREITVRHLLMQTSGLNDVFYPLWEKITSGQKFSITPRDAIIWGREHLKPVSEPGKGFCYTDTNYYLLGLIIENITGKRFHEVMHEMIFGPLGMKHAYMFGFSKPELDAEYPPAKLYIKNIDLTAVEGIHQIDYAGGSVTAPLDEYLIFMKALVNHRLVGIQTLNRMVNDDVDMGFPTIGFRYGYSVWKPKTIPLLLPEKFSCWGCVGVTGAFMFYHPATEAYIIGSFNDFSYRGKALQFMMKRVINELLKCSK